MLHLKPYTQIFLNMLEPWRGGSKHTPTHARMGWSMTTQTSSAQASTSPPTNHYMSPDMGAAAGLNKSMFMWWAVTFSWDSFCCSYMWWCEISVLFIWIGWIHLKTQNNQYWVFTVLTCHSKYSPEEGENLMLDHSVHGQLPACQRFPSFLCSH